MLVACLVPLRYVLLLLFAPQVSLNAVAESISFVKSMRHYLTVFIRHLKGCAESDDVQLSEVEKCGRALERLAHFCEPDFSDTAGSLQGNQELLVHNGVTSSCMDLLRKLASHSLQHLTEKVWRFLANVVSPDLTAANPSSYCAKDVLADFARWGKAEEIFDPQRGYTVTSIPAIFFKAAFEHQEVVRMVTEDESKTDELKVLLRSIFEGILRPPLSSKTGVLRPPQPYNPKLASLLMNLQSWYDVDGHTDQCWEATARVVLQEALKCEGIIPRTKMEKVSTDPTQDQYQLRCEMLIDGDNKWVNVQDNDRYRRYVGNTLHLMAQVTDAQFEDSEDVLDQIQKRVPEDQCEKCIQHLTEEHCPGRTAHFGFGDDKGGEIPRFAADKDNTVTYTYTRDLVGPVKLSIYKFGDNKPVGEEQSYDRPLRPSARAGEDSFVWEADHLTDGSGILLPVGSYEMVLEYAQKEDGALENNRIPFDLVENDVGDLRAAYCKLFANIYGKPVLSQPKQHRGRARQVPRLARSSRSVSGTWAQPRLSRQRSTWVDPKSRLSRQTSPQRTSPMTRTRTNSPARFSGGDSPTSPGSPGSPGSPVSPQANVPASVSTYPVTSLQYDNASQTREVFDQLKTLLQDQADACAGSTTVTKQRSRTDDERDGPRRHDLKQLSSAKSNSSSAGFKRSSSNPRPRQQSLLDLRFACALLRSVRSMLEHQVGWVHQDGAEVETGKAELIEIEDWVCTVLKYFCNEADLHRLTHRKKKWTEKLKQKRWQRTREATVSTHAFYQLLVMYGSI